ncbi:MAG: hypothetical protein H6713_23840, partial [Myxococcales bacterium]|nr:hypothetical protein [Myxococcales bacterium]
LRARASRLTVILPWGSLLRAVTAPELETLARLRALCQPGASLELVFSHDARDRQKHAPLGPEDAMSEAHARGLASVYPRAGFEVRSIERLEVTALRAYPTTWAKRLGHGRARDVYRLRASASASPQGSSASS